LPTKDRDLIRAAMERTGLSARALAALCDVDERTMRRWQAEESPMPGSARQLLRVLVAEPQRVMEILDAHPRPPGWLVAASKR
jgi:DNA-binding transcriptional regulator YiaG